MNKKLGEDSSKLTPSSPISRIKSLIKPPPPRSSWELLLDDYLKDPNLKSNFTSRLSPTTSQSFEQSIPRSSQPTSFNPIDQTFIPSLYPHYTLPKPCESSSPLPPRRYQTTLDELVYLISQVGRSDLYREMVQYIKTQKLPAVSKTSSPQSIHPASNVNACSTNQSTESFFLIDRKGAEMN